MTRKLYIGSKGYSSWSLRGWLAMKHTGLNFEEVLLVLDTPEFYKALDGISPTFCVPALLDGDTKVWDSLAVIEYASRLAPEKFWWPEDMNAYATARSISAEMHSSFTALRSHAPMNIKGRYGKLKVAEPVQKNIDRIEAIWTETRQTFGHGSDFLFGEFSAADMMFAPVVSRFKTYGIDVSATALEYMEAVLNHPHMLEWYQAALLETHKVTVDILPENTIHLG